MFFENIKKNKSKFTGSFLDFTQPNKLREIAHLMDSKGSSRNFG